jgi:hypothetical protein
MMAAILLATLWPAQAGEAGDARSRMSVPPPTVFQGMLRFAAEGEAAKLERSLDLLGPVLAEHERVFGQEATRALIDRLRGSDRTRLVGAVRLLVARDIVVLLRDLPGAPRPRAQTLLRTAMVEWRLLEGAALGIDLRHAQSVSRLLRDVEAAVESGQAEEIGPLVERIEKELLRLIA